MQAAVYFLFLLVAGISARPMSYSASSPTGSCGSTPSCQLPAKVKFAYETGKTYTYSVNSAIKTLTSNSDSKEAGLQVSATAKIGVIASCELQLELSSVELKDENGNKINDRKFIDDLKLPVRFEWIDGRISDVCPTSEQESQWSLNFKRSVLSALQNSMDSLDSSEPTREIDVTGDCWANYEVEQPGKSVKWTKNLNQCADRQGGVHATFGVKYDNPMSDLHTMPLTEGKQTCTQTFNKNVISKVECKERVEFMPSRLQEGAVKVITEATMTIKLVTEESGVSTAPPSKYVTSLKFDHSYVPANQESDIKETEKLLDKMCTGDVIPESGRDYSDLLDSLRSLSKDELAKVYESAQKCKASAKMMQKVIADVATTAASHFIVQKVESSNDQSKTLVREDWLASLQGVLDPAAETLEKAAIAVTSKPEYAITGRGYLGVGALINNYCMRHRNCENSEGEKVKAAIQHFARQLDMCRSGSADPETTRRALYSLRALGNAGPAIAMERYPEIINTCMSNKALTAEIRISAMTVMRRVPCGHENQQATETLRNIVRDNKEDTELRSVALISMLRCPCIGDLDVIRSVITDKSNQVTEKFGAFIISYITRMEETPGFWYWTPEFRSTLSALMSTREAALLAMKVEPMKTGAALHRQHFWPKMNAGYMVDLDLLHSDNSKYPRQLRVNTTLALFGLATSPVEIGLRQEGLESLVENLPSLDVLEKPKDGLISLPRINTEKLRPILEKLKLSFFVRVFGSEVRYASLDKEVMDRLVQRMDHRVDVAGLKSDEGRQAASLFVDRALSLPTVAGLPLRLAIRGSYRSQIRPTMEPAITHDSDGRLTSLDLKGDVKAGVSIELRSSVAAYIGGRQYGIQAVSRFASRAEYKPEIKWEGRSLKVKFDLPSKTIRAASISNEVFVRHDKVEEPIVIDSEVRKTDMCTPGLSGVKLCVHAETPSRWNGLVTPGKASLSLEKSDETMKGAEFEFRADHTLGSDGKIETIEFKAYGNTPGSSQDRKMLAELKLSRPQRQLTATLETPWKKANLEVKMSGEADNQETKATFAIGEGQSPKRTYNLLIKRSSGSVSEGDQKHPKRSVVVELTRSDVDKAILKAKGSITDMGDLKAVLLTVSDLHIVNYYTLSSPVSLTGEYGKNLNRGYGFALKGTLPTRTFETEFGLKMEPEGKQIAYSHRFHYQSKQTGTSDQSYDRTVLWEVEYKREQGKILLLKSVFTVRTPDMPVAERASHRVLLLLERPTPDDLVTDLQVEVGSGSDVKRFRLGQKLYRQELSTMRSFKYALTASGFGLIDRTVSVSYERKWEPTQLLNLDAEIRRGDVAIYRVVLYGRRDAPGFGEFKFRTLCPYSDFLLQGKGEKTEDNTFVHSLRLERNGDLRFNFESRAQIGEERYVDARLEIMGMVPITLRSRGRGSIFDGEWKHDAVLAYGPRKLLLGGDVKYQESPKGDIEGTLDCNFYFGTPERMFKQYINWYRMDRLVKINGMTEFGDDMYKISGQLDMAARRHQLLVEGPRGSSEIVFGRLSNQRGYDVTLTYRCPSIELQLFSKAGLNILRSDLAGHFAYKLPDSERKVIGFKLGYKADLTEGVDLGLISSVQVNRKQWLAVANCTMKKEKFAVSLGASNADIFRHVFTVMFSRKWETEHILRLGSEIELHSTILKIPQFRYESDRKISWNPDTGRLGGYEANVRVSREDKEGFYTIKVEAMDPRKGLTVSVFGETPYTKRTEVKLSYTASKASPVSDLPTITILGNVRYGEKARRLRGLIELTKADKTGLDYSYSLAGYADENQHAEVSIRGQHVTDFKTRIRGFMTIEVRDQIYSMNGRFNNDAKKLLEFIVLTPHENYRENMIRIWGKEDTVDFTFQSLVKIGPNSVRFNGWRKVEPTSRRGEGRLTVNGRIYAVGWTVDHPENGPFTRGEHRLRLRLDMPVVNYNTSTVMLWFNPASKGPKGIAAVLGLTDAYPDIKEQRTQMQVAYQVGDLHKGAILLSARAERNYETKKLFREASLIVKLPRVDVTIDGESTRYPEKGSGWVEYRSERLGKWRAEWSGSGSSKKAGTAQLELRGVMPSREEPVVVRLSSSHDDDKKDITGQITTNVQGYERVRVSYSRSLDEEDNIANSVEIVLPSGQKIQTTVSFGLTVEQVDLKLKMTTPFEIVRELEGGVEYRNEAPRHTVEIKFHRNERRYSLNAIVEKDKDAVSGDLKLETPFDKFKSASGSFKRTGNLKDGSQTKAEFTVNGQWTLSVDSEGRFGGENKYISTVVKANKEEYKLIVNKEPGKFELRLPTPWACIIHYTGEISTAENIFMGIRHHHQCSPYAFNANITISLQETKEFVINAETPIPYFKTFSTSLSWEFDEATYQIDQKLPPMGLHVVVKREDKTAEMDLKVNPDEKSSSFLLTVRGVTIKTDARVGNLDGGHIIFNVETPAVSIDMRIKRDGSWIKPTNVEAVLTAANLDLYSLNGNWDFERYPRTFKVEVNGVVYSKQCKVVATGETTDPSNWKRNVEVKVGPKTHKYSSELKAGKKLQIKYDGGDKNFQISGDFDHTVEGDRRRVKSVVEISQAGFTTKFSTLKWTSNDVSPKIDVTKSAQSPAAVIMQALSSNEWNQVLIVDGVEKFSSAGYMRVIPPRDLTLVGLKIDYEITHKVDDKKRHVIIQVEKPEAGKPTNFKLLVEVNDEKKVDVTGSIERRDSFLKYTRVKLDFQAPKQMSFDIERDATNDMNRVWKSYINFDKSVDKVGNMWQLNVKPADGVSARGAELVLTCKRGQKETLLVEAGFQRLSDKTFHVKYHLLFKTSNMDKKYGVREEYSYDNMIVYAKTEFSSLTRDILVQTHAGYEASPKRIFYIATYNLGTPSTKLDMNFELVNYQKLTGTVKLGEKKVVNVDGAMTVTDRHNYEVNLKVSDDESNMSQFTFKKHLSGEKRTIESSIKTNKGEIEWNSQLTDGEKIRTRSFVLRIYKSEWAPNEAVLLKGESVIDKTVPSLKVKLDTPFHKFQYSLHVERRDQDVKEIVGRLVRHDDKAEMMNLLFDPTHHSFDYTRTFASNNVLKVHGHISSTQTSFFEAKRTVTPNGPYENLVRITETLAPTELLFNLKYNTQLVEIIRDYISSRREEAKEILSKYRENIPKGIKLMQEIMLFDKLVMPFVNTMRNERLQLRETERAKWREIVKTWYESSDAQNMVLPQRLPPFSESIAYRLLSDEQTEIILPTAEQLAVDRALVAVGQAVRQFVKEDLIQDLREVAEKKKEDIETPNPITYAVAGIRTTLREYITEAVQRLRDRSWTSCLIHLAKQTHEKVKQLYSDRPEILQMHERLLSALARVRSYFVELSERYMTADSQKQTPLLAAIRESIAKSEFKSESGEISAKIVLPYSDMRSLRMPLHLMLRIEAVRGLLERGIASVKARLVNPTAQVEPRQMLGLLQYYHISQLKHLFQ